MYGKYIPKEITPDLIEAALEILYAYNPDSSDGRSTVKEIIQLVLANPVQERAAPSLLIGSCDLC
jgi:hypothetical protein